ncbi:MAG TPA: pantetheine-phosphate adenylyltransferase [Gemmataceae bacterium]|nr:pantetheine-phosphate adenylyltransferase [Gemmataceae bacterium]
MATAKRDGIAVYTGVFDPVHLGHLDVIERGCSIFDRVIVGVGINPDKAPFFSTEERVELLKTAVRPYANVEVEAFDDLAVRFVRRVGAHVMLRGLRTTSDMEYEFNMSLMNHSLDPGIETVFLMAKDTYSHVTGSLLRQIATFGGPLDKFVPQEVAAALVARVRERQA